MKIHNPLALALSLSALAFVGGCKDDSSMNTSKSAPMKSPSASAPAHSGAAHSTPAQQTGDIIDVATGPGMTEVSTLVTAVKAADLVDTLKGKGPFTVFAPTNAAFAKLPPAALADLLKPENKGQLKSVLLYHVHAGAAVPAAQVKTMSLSTANGKPLQITVNNGTVMVNNAKVIRTDVMASNGIIHWIDTVVMP